MVLRLLIKNFPIIAIIIAIGALIGCFLQTRRLKQSMESNNKLKTQIRSMSEYINSIQQQGAAAIEGAGVMRPVSPPSSPIPSEPDYTPIDHEPEPVHSEPEPVDEEPEPLEPASAPKEPEPVVAEEPGADADADIEEEPETPVPKPQKRGGRKRAK